MQDANVSSAVPYLTLRNFDDPVVFSLNHFMNVRLHGHNSLLLIHEFFPLPLTLFSLLLLLRN